MHTQPFTVDIPQTTLDDPPAAGRHPWAGGAGRELAGGRHEPWVPSGAGGWWQTGFDWRPEAAINRFAHYRATVDGVKLHVVYERGRAWDDSHRSGPAEGEVAWEHLLVYAEEAFGLPARWRTERH